MKLKKGDRIVATETMGTMFRKGDVGTVVSDKYKLLEVQFDNQSRTWYLPQKYCRRFDVIEETGTIDEQTIMFWNLQLQFMNIDNYFRLVDIANGIDQRQLIFKNLSNEELATQLALQLSGLST